VVVAATVVLASAACKDSTDPAPSLVGTWDLIGFSDGGISGTTTGTIVFRTNGTFSANGTVTFPGEPTDQLLVDGTYSQSDFTVTLTSAMESAQWSMTVDDDEITLTEIGGQATSVIKLRRQT
jgi:hypothetical protein